MGFKRNSSPALFLALNSNFDSHPTALPPPPQTDPANRWLLTSSRPPLNCLPSTSQPLPTPPSHPIQPSSRPFRLCPHPTASHLGHSAALAVPPSLAGFIAQASARVSLPPPHCSVYPHPGHQRPEKPIKYSAPCESFFGSNPRVSYPLCSGHTGPHPALPSRPCQLAPLPLSSLLTHPIFKTANPGTSLVAQCLRICLPMQGTWVRALRREDPTCRGATKPAREPQLPSPCPQLLKPTCLEPMLCNKRSQCNEKPPYCNKEWPPLAATRESLRTATKTQHSNK